MHEGIIPARADQREAVPRNTPAGEIDVVDHRETGEERRNLVGAPQSAPDALMRGENRHILAEEADQPGRRQEIAGDAVEERGLARAVRTENRAPLARAHGERHIGNGGQRAEHLRDAAQFQRVAGADIGLPQRNGARRVHRRVHAAPPVPSASRRCRRARQRSHRPSTPSGENRTTARKPRPMISLKRSAEKPKNPRISGEKTCSST